jgi:uncharacterized damage-inducible protein DinB
MKPHFSMFARYNEWANRRLYTAAATLSDQDYRLERGAFFGSVHRTLNHLLVTDRIWMRRLSGEGPTYTALDVVPYDDLASLRSEREAEDRRIVGFIDGLDDARLAASVTYRTITSPQEITQPLAPALLHLFNHQTHHRGQAHALLTGLGGRGAAPSLDLILFQRESGMGLT